MAFYKDENRAGAYCESGLSVPTYYITNALREVGLSDAARLMEIGSGSGVLAEALRRKPLSITCADYSHEMIGYFKQRLKRWGDHKITCAVLEAAASDTQQRDNSHDALILMNAIHWLLISEEDTVNNRKELQRILKSNAPVIAISTFPCIKPVEKITDSETDPTAFWSFVQNELKTHDRFDQNCVTLLSHRNNNGRRGMMQNLTGNTDIRRLEVEKYELPLTLPAAVNRIISLQPYQNIEREVIEDVCQRFLRSCNPQTRWLARGLIGVKSH
jgi:phospholipid N-methyltransferase